MTRIEAMTVWYSPEREGDRFLPEGPREFQYDGRAGLIWVNIQESPDSQRGALHFRSFDGAIRRCWPVPGRPGFVLITSDINTVYLGLDKDVGHFNLTDNHWHRLATIPDSNPRTTINDGELLPDGSGAIFGTKDVNFAEPLGHLYFHDFQNHRIVTLTDGQTCSNGKVILGNRLYDIDSPRKVVSRYRWDGNSVKFEGIAIDLRDREDFPDGMIDGGNGTVIVAFYNPHPRDAGELVRFRLDTGSPVESWQVPGSPRVTCPVLTSDGNLFCTTATEGMSAEDRKRCPNAGSLFRITNPPHHPHSHSDRTS